MSRKIVRCSCEFVAVVFGLLGMNVKSHIDNELFQRISLVPLLSSLSLAIHGVMLRDEKNDRDERDDVLCRYIDSDTIVP